MLGRIATAVKRFAERRQIGFLATLLAACVAFAAAMPARSERSADSYLGMWKGIITQDLGPTIRYFDMEMSVAERKGETGLYDISCHVMDGDYHAYMAGEARVLPNGQLYVHEDEIVRADSIPGMAWCLKRLELRKSMEKGMLHLRGRWEGDTYFGACPPGKMDLVRPVLRP